MDDFLDFTDSAAVAPPIGIEGDIKPKVPVPLAPDSAKKK
jgi:hypothetical protein